MALTLTRMVWRFADAEWAAGLRPGQLHGRIAKGVIRLTPDDVAGNGTGTSSWLTYPTITQLALFAQLYGLGFGAHAAGVAARKFSDEGNDGRDPAMLFPEGRTILIAAATGPLFVDDPEPTGLAGAQVMNRPEGAGVLMLGPCQVCVDCNKVLAALKRRLDAVAYD